MFATINVCNQYCITFICYIITFSVRKFIFLQILQVGSGSKVQSSAQEFHIAADSVNSLLTCSLCSGYLHNAVTITECLHSCVYTLCNDMILSIVHIHLCQ